jgi:hypothetical protein
MIDTSNWDYGYKISRGEQCTTNMLYTPLINPERTIMCMVWDEQHPYQKDNTRLTTELVNFFFEREVKYLTMFQDRPWCPKIIEIDLENRKIFVEWNKESVNNIIFTDGRSLDIECPDWKEQIFVILNDIVTSGYYKMALYPHCFFIDQRGKIKTIDFYGCLSAKERYLERKKIEGMIGKESGDRFDAVTDNQGMLDFEKFFKHTVKVHLANAWPDNPFPDYYKRIYND